MWARRQHVGLLDLLITLFATSATAKSKEKKEKKHTNTHSGVFKRGGGRWCDRPPPFAVTAEIFGYFLASFS